MTIEPSVRGALPGRDFGGPKGENVRNAPTWRAQEQAMRWERATARNRLFRATPMALMGSAIDKKSAIVGGGYSA